MLSLKKMLGLTFGFGILAVATGCASRANDGVDLDGPSEGVLCRSTEVSASADADDSTDGEMRSTAEAHRRTRGGRVVRNGSVYYGGRIAHGGGIVRRGGDDHGGDGSFGGDPVFGASGARYGADGIFVPGRYATADGVSVSCDDDGVCWGL